YPLLERKNRLKKCLASQYMIRMLSMKYSILQQNVKLKQVFIFSKMPLSSRLSTLKQENHYHLDIVETLLLQLYIKQVHNKFAIIFKIFQQVMKLNNVLVEAGTVKSITSKDAVTIW